MSDKAYGFSIGGILKSSLTFYWRNLFTLWLPFLLVSVPAEKILDYLGGRYFSETFVEAIFSFLSYGVTELVSLYVLLTVISLYRKEEIVIQDNINRIKSLLFPFIALQVIILLAVFGGFLLLFIPGIILALRWSLSTVVFVIEERSPLESMKRSRFVTNGHKGEIFLIFLIIALIGFSLNSLFTMMDSGLARGFRGVFDSYSTVSGEPFSLFSISHSALTSLLMPVYPLLAFRIYLGLTGGSPPEDDELPEPHREQP